MKKYTAPEVEVIKFQIQEAIADNETGLPSGNIGVGTAPAGGMPGWDD